VKAGVHDAEKLKDTHGVNSAGSVAVQNNNCGNFFTDVIASGGTAPTDTIQAPLDINNNPTQAVSAIYNLVPPISPYQTTLARYPSSWSLPISPAYMSISGSSSVSIGAAAKSTQAQNDCFTSDGNVA
jgi:hypothetical protein